MEFDKKIQAIKFGILSPDNIVKMSVVKIIVSETYDEDGTQIPNGLMDPRLGVIDPEQKCATCGNGMGTCIGHFGRIELSVPVVIVGFNKQIYKIIRATCRELSCGRIKLTEEDILTYRQKLEDHKKTWGNMNFELIEKIMKQAAKATVCPHCEKEQWKIKLEKPTTFYEEKEIERPNGDLVRQSNKLLHSEIHNWLQRISDEDCELLGIDPKVARPEWMVMTVLPVPPVSVRPSITLENGTRAEDDLTHKLVDIIRINQRLQQNRETGSPQLIVEDLWELLSYHVSTYLDNELSGVPPARHRSGRSLRTLSHRLKGKNGRFRSNLSGKRVDFSARTVITPDTLLSINEVGVPEDIARILTVPQRITEWNIEQMKELVMRGPSSKSGANYVIREDGRRVDLRFVTDPSFVADSLEPGYVIERHLQDGDIVLFNRQPSLHRMSIMAHYVKIMPYKTFRLSLAVCRPYNADFDGDEMNLHVPQSEEAQAEARMLMLVSQNISTPRYGGPIIGGMQDFITGAYKITNSDARYGQEEIGQLLAAAGVGRMPPPDLRDEDGDPIWMGRTIMSQILPDKLNFTMKNGLCKDCTNNDKSHLANNVCPNDGLIVIHNGKLIAGAFDKKAIGAEQSDSVLDRILKEFGANAAQEFLDRFSKLVVAALTLEGFSISIRDVDLPNEGKMAIDSIINQAKEKVLQVIKDYREEKLERRAGQTLTDTVEANISEILSGARESAGSEATQFVNDDNSALIMAVTGARGSLLNLGQMAANVGQQSVRGHRIIRGYKNRTLPHFRPFDISANARGFVDSSFNKGLNPIEFFFHAAGGREGLVDTAARTSTSGYLQRRLINALQDVSVQYDGTIRNAMGNVIQFQFGEDGVDPAKSDHGRIVNLDIIIDQVLAEGKE